MNKYIELGKAIGAVNGAFKFEVETPDNYKDIAVETLKLLPSVEVVRCRECVIMDDLISKLSEIRSEYNCFDEDEEPYYRALSKAIRILSRHTDGDTISRQAAIDAIERLILPQTNGETAAEEINRVAWRCAINCAEEMIAHLPSAERHGRWEDPEDLTCYKCSVCGEYATQEYGLTEPIFWHYCPNCGSRMDLEGDIE